MSTGEERSSGDRLQRDPFHPFFQMEGPVLDFASQRSEVVMSIRRLIEDNQFPVAVLSGSSGVGKSTIVRSLLPPSLRASGLTVVTFTGSPTLSAQQLGSEVAISLGFSDTRYARRYGESGQSVGAIDQSSRVRVSQVAATASVDLERQTDEIDLVGWLDALVRGSSSRVVVVIDQVEQLYLPGARADSIRVIDQLLRCAELLKGAFSIVLSVRDRYIHEIFHLAVQYPGLTRRVVPVHGLDVADARSFLEAGLEWLGVSFSARLTEQLLARLQGSDGRIWPVALHAGCRQLANVARRRRRSATVTDLEKLGDLSGILANAILDELGGLGTEGTGDALFVLASVSSTYRTNGPVPLDELNRLLPSYSSPDLISIVEALTGLRLLEKDRSSNVRPSHDSIGFAVESLRAPKGVALAMHRLDAAVLEWSGMARPEEIPDLPLNEILRLRSLPTPHLIFLGVLIFERDIDSDIATQLRARIAAVPAEQLVRSVRVQARRQGRHGSLAPNLVFVLLSAQHDVAVDAALQGLRAAAEGPDVRWLPSGYQVAIDRSGVQLGPTALRTCALETWRPAASRIVLRSCIRQDSVELPSDVVELWWRSGPRVLRTEVLQLVAVHSPGTARQLIDEALESDQDYLRAAAAEAATVAGIEDSNRIVRAAVEDRSTVVRRRAVYLLARSTDVTMLASIAGGDPSSLVREAAVECMGELASPEFESVLLGSLTDSASIVRESAVYALRHVLGNQRAAEVVSHLVTDESPHVREAALRVLALGERPPDPELILADLRSGSDSLRSAALGILALSDSAVAAPILSDLMADNEASKASMIGALRLAAAGRLRSTMSDLSRIVSEVDDAETLCEAALALQSIGGPDTSPMLCSLVFHPSADVRERAVYALAEVGGPEAINVLMSCLYDPSDSIRVRAVYGLARLRVERARSAVQLMNRSSSELDEAITYYLREVETVD